MKEISIIIPTLNAEKVLPNLFRDIKDNLSKMNYEVIVVDSSSDDNTIKIAKENKAKVINISRSNFNHGGTRNLGIENASGEFVVFFTQDIVLYDSSSIKNLVKVFEDESIAIAYGRQLPYKDSGVFGSYVRLFNYSENSLTKDLSCKNELGIKTIFCSNSFAAYRKSIHNKLGGFPEKVILGEDMYFAAKAINSGYKLSYVADAKVYHSHDYSIIEEFKRNFDIGVFHATEHWIFREYNGAQGEGIRLVLNEIKFLISNKHFMKIPYSILRNAAKFFGYKLGTKHKHIPIKWKIKISMYKSYWAQ